MSLLRGSVALLIGRLVLEQFDVVVPTQSDHREPAAGARVHVEPPSHPVGSSVDERAVGEDQFARRNGRRRTAPPHRDRAR